MQGGLMTAAPSNVHDSSQIPSYPTYFLISCGAAVSHGATTARMRLRVWPRRRRRKIPYQMGLIIVRVQDQIITYLKSSELGNGIHRRGHSRLAT